MWQDLFNQLFLLMFLSGIGCDVKKKKKKYIEGANFSAVDLE